MKNKIFGYARVSSKEQNEERQIVAFKDYGIDERDIYIDKQSGKDFDRPNYQIMKSKLKRDDLLIIKSIDRLGRNYEMIIKEWSDITKIIEADICVIDFPLLDTRSENTNLVGKFISDIVLQVLSFVAQNERENIRQRQAEGIRIAKEKGVHMGRPKYKLPNNFTEIVVRYHNKELTHIEAAEILNMTRGTFLKYSKLIKKEQD